MRTTHTLLNRDRLSHENGKQYTSLARRLKRLSSKNKSFEKLRYWILSPACLWPIPFDVIANFVLSPHKRNNRYKKTLNTLLNLLMEPPSDLIRNTLLESRNNLKTFIQTQCKLRFQQYTVENSKELLRDWKNICTQFDVRQIRDKSGFVLCSNDCIKCRCLRKWNSKREQLQSIFDVFCHRYKIIGMKGNKPIARFLSIEPNPNGTSLFVPASISFDAHRDLKWPHFTILHGIHGCNRQGLKRAMNKLETLDEVKRLKTLMLDPAVKNLKGSKRETWLISKMGWDPKTSPRRLYRLLNTPSNPKQ